VARDLLTESGSIFVQIGDENVHKVRSLLDEIFGDENFVSLIVFVKTGGLAESLSIVSSSKDKKKLSALTGAVALDMESIAIAKIAMEHSLPFLVIRVIADTVNMNLPQAINYSLNTQGEIVMKKLLLFLLLHPAELPDLIKLGLNFNAAKKTLRSIAIHLEQLTNFDLSIATSQKIDL
jgi:hypothetical protein